MGNTLGLSFFFFLLNIGLKGMSCLLQREMRMEQMFNPEGSTE